MVERRTAVPARRPLSLTYVRLRAVSCENAEVLPVGAKEPLTSAAVLLCDALVFTALQLIGSSHDVLSRSISEPVNPEALRGGWN